VPIVEQEYIAGLGGMERCTVIREGKAMPNALELSSMLTAAKDTASSTARAYNTVRKRLN
jgi:hypothetical protein